MVKWPAVIKYQGEDELIYIESLAEWQSDPDLCESSYEVEDRLIDASGALFSFSSQRSIAKLVITKSAIAKLSITQKSITKAPITKTSEMQPEAFVDLDESIGVIEFVELVRKHAVLENYCCSAKLNARTHQQVIAMVKEINSI
ncbi:hypothetical protein HWV00_13325 [Moritella sp. 24]|uniref:DUF4144 family protein n=1 Tax=Moritella sp. 24 TaxID=2746230 RepID=UPI001BA80C8E|nr:DUF4144 family protein [Moritella sp. 24]QUM77134.1 hypothetical protein HWV00_13325 [Moritella sp. 24]